jgi:hypothetical protein
MPSPGSPTPPACEVDPSWHPQYKLPGGWAAGYCLFTTDCDTPGYATELACCKGAYGGQVSGACLNALPNPPTQSPTPVGGLPFYYADYDTAWSEAGCINKRPVPSGRPVYQSMLDCCKGAYGGQVSGELVDVEAYAYFHLMNFCVPPLPPTKIKLLT